MTLILCLRGTDGMVLASDSRGTFGDPRGVTAQNDNQKKLYAVSKYVGILTAGGGELGAMIMEETRQRLSVEKIEGATLVMNVARDILKKKFQEWFQSFLIVPVQGAQAPVRPDQAIIVAGYDLNAEGKPDTQKIYSLVSRLDFAPMLHDYGFALQGVGQYALYLLNRLYVSGSSVKNLVPLAAYVITETASQDGKVGGPIQMLTITPTDGAKELNRDEIDKVVADNGERSKILRVSFFGT